MRGLMQKDIEILKGNLKIFGSMYLIAVLLLVTTGREDATFFVMYVTLISGIVVLNTISYDDMDNGMLFLFTLPVTRREYVKEKYTFGIMLGMGGWLIGLVIATLWSMASKPALDLQVWLLGCTPGIFVIIFILTVMVPIQLKFGSENSRMIMIIVMLGFMGIAAGAIAITKKLGVDMAQVIYGIDALGLPVLGLLVVLLCAVCLFASYRISIGILEKKEF